VQQAKCSLHSCQKVCPYWVLCSPAHQRVCMLLAPCNKRIAVYTLAKNFAPAGFCARQRVLMRFALLATSEMQFTPLPKTLPLLGFVPASGFMCYSLLAMSEIQFTLLPKTLLLLGFVFFPSIRQRGFKTTCPFSHNKYIVYFFVYVQLPYSLLSFFSIQIFQFFDLLAKT